MPWITTEIATRWNQGTFHDAYTKLGAHPNARGTWFAVWAPHADRVSVIGDFNGWDNNADNLRRVPDCGIWEIYVRGAQAGQTYKYHIENGDYAADKTDPFAFSMEAPVEGGHPIRGMASVISDLTYTWNDDDWTTNRKGPDGLNDPISVYEVHLGSWRHAQPGQSYSYREIAEPLAEYVTDLGFTHVELMPVLEHPYYASWGYQVAGFYAPTYRYGSPTDFMYLIDTLHQAGIGVIVDWVPAHFATDPQSLVFFDGEPLFEYRDPVMRHHPDWGTYVFDYASPGVRNFLISNAHFWLEKYHVDGLRTDAVASMLYRDYSRSSWTPNIHGGRENLEAISFFQELNASVYAKHDSALMIAEESTAWPGVTQPTYAGGLGFLYKWNMGWMHDTLTYMHEDPLYRSHHHDSLTFPLIYAFSEHYILPLSHDEVVHMKGSLWNKMPGDQWQKAANLRLLLAHQIGHPGKKLLFMGAEFGQLSEWNCDGELDWHLLNNRMHAGIQNWVRTMLQLYRKRPALWSDAPESFSWIDFEDRTASVVSYTRQRDGDTLVFVFNFTPVVRPDYELSLPLGGSWHCLHSSDDDAFGGSGLHDVQTISVETIDVDHPSRVSPAATAVEMTAEAKDGTNDERVGSDASPEARFVTRLTLPPLGVLVLSPAPKGRTN